MSLSWAYYFLFEDLHLQVYDNAGLTIKGLFNIEQPFLIDLDQAKTAPV
jgi:hypothetical protein